MIEPHDSAPKALIDVLEYSNHASQLKGSQPSQDRIERIEQAIKEAFGKVISIQKVEYVCFGDLTAEELAAAFVAHPQIIKSTLSCINVAQRAITRDLGITIDTYCDRISPTHAGLLAAYVKPMLPHSIALPALMELDRYAWADKELRASKGNWERRIVTALIDATDLGFSKTKFSVTQNASGKSEFFELDGAYRNGDNIDIGVDVKRIESPRDIHKRADEIINKANHFKHVYPEGTFFAVIYYPFPSQHVNIISRLSSPLIDGIFFAGESDSSIDAAISLLASKINQSKKN